jgi:hypothetical protein
MYKNTACSVAQDGGGVTGPACWCQHERNLKDHRKGSTKEALTGRQCLYNGLQRHDIVDNRMNVGVCCKTPGFINTREVEKNQCICLCLHCAHEGRSGRGTSHVESVCMRHPKYTCRGGVSRGCMGMGVATVVASCVDIEHVGMGIVASCVRERGHGIEASCVSKVRAWESRHPGWA